MFHSKALKIFPNFVFWFENRPSGNNSLEAGEPLWLSGKVMKINDFKRSRVRSPAPGNLKK
jgi:hypothetical protein